MPTTAPSMVSTSDGFVLGGQTSSSHGNRNHSASSKLRSKYPSKNNNSQLIPQDVYEMGSSESKEAIMSPYKKTNSDLYKLSNQSMYDNNAKTTITKGEVQSFVLNEDMKNIRYAEQIILNEEKKFGTYDRDPNGRLVPAEQVRFLFHFILCIIIDHKYICRHIWLI